MSYVLVHFLLTFDSPDGTLQPLHAPYHPKGPQRNMGPPAAAPSRTPNPYGGRTPGWGRTPNPYASGDGKTPAWNASSRTPNPYADGGKTPAWNASSRTPNPYAADGGRTPAWNASSRTPNPYTESSSWGSSAWGGSASPARPADSGWSSWVSFWCWTMVKVL